MVVIIRLEPMVSSFRDAIQRFDDLQYCLGVHSEVISHFLWWFDVEVSVQGSNGLNVGLGDVSNVQAVVVKI